MGEVWEWRYVVDGGEEMRREEERAKRGYK